ncbi:MAG: putative DNA-invertase from lambdoid prophage Rac [Verrucomicrobiota bacterium]|jgi:DNA invertase Pin-like site-specific DNA recombinase
MPPITEAILYRRVSTNTQQSSLDSQDSLCLEYCATRNTPVIAIFEDNDTSGSIPFRERKGPDGGAAMLELIEARAELAGTPSAGPMGDRLSDIIVVVLKQDRLGRDTLDQIATVRHLWNLGVVPHLVTEGGAIPRTPHNEFIFEVKASTAQLERNLIKDRVQIGLNNKRSKGELCGHIPYGWNAIATGQITGKGVKVRRLIDNPEEQRWLLHMVKRRREGWGYHSIAKELNAAGVATKRGKGALITVRGSKQGGGPGEQQFCSGQWQPGNVSHVLNNDTTKAWLAAQRDLA